METYRERRDRERREAEAREESRQQAGRERKRQELEAEAVEYEKQLAEDYSEEAVKGDSSLQQHKRTLEATLGRLYDQIDRLADTGADGD